MLNNPDSPAWLLVDLSWDPTAKSVGFFFLKRKEKKAERQIPPSLGIIILTEPSK